jgi:glycosyltransferase involved in cell wall biosynthesis
LIVPQQNPPPQKVVVLGKQVDGGTGTFVLQLMKLNDIEAGLRLFFLILEQPSKRQVGDGCHIHYFRNANYYKNYYSLVPKTLGMAFSETLWFFDQLRTIRPDVILAIDTHCSLIATLYKLRYPKTRLIVSVHNNLAAVARRKLSAPLTSFLKFTGHYLFSQADQVVGVSQGVSRTLQTFFHLKKEVKTIYYGVDLQRIARLARQPLPGEYAGLFQSDRKVILSVGRFDAQKDFPAVIQAFHRLGETCPEATLLLIGDGEDKEKLAGLVKDLGIGDRVCFVGWQQNIFSYLARSDLFVYSSLYDGFPFVVLEALAAGVPVISTDAPFGPREILGDGDYGLLVPVGNPDRLADAMCRLLGDGKLRQGYLDRAKAGILNFSEARMLSAYRSILAG